MKLVIFGNRKTCSYCKTFDRVLATKTFVDWKTANNVTVIDCDKSDPVLFTEWKKRLGWNGGAFPHVCVLNEKNRQQGAFTGRNLTADKLITKIEDICPSCGIEPDVVPSRKTCPTCKGLGTVLASLIATVFLSGCTYTQMQTLEGGGYKVTRYSLLQKVAIPQVTILQDGSVSLDEYANDGGGEAFASVAAKAYELGKKAAVTAAK